MWFRRIALGGAILVAVSILVWVATVIPRVRKIKAENATWLSRSYPDWTPSRDVPPAGIEIPDTSDVDWLSLYHTVDHEGVRVVDYDKIGQRGVSGRQRNPALISGFGITTARRWSERGEEQFLLLALRQFDYLQKSARRVVIDGRPAVLWEADYDLGYQYNVKAPWRSAFFQAYCVTALAWAYWLTGEERHLDTIERGIVPLGYTIEEGGVSFETQNGGLFFEEVITTPLHHILNGHLTTLICLHNIGRFTGSEEAMRIFERGVRGTEDMLAEYDKRGYSLYSLSPNSGLKNHFNIANPEYHHQHVAQLRTLYEITGSEMFREYADKWERETEGLFDVVWTALFVMFKDAMRVMKAIT